MAAAQQRAADAQGAVLRGLDKVSGQAVDIEVPTGGSAEFGQLTIKLNACRYPSDSPTSDAFAELEITEAGSEAPAFSGWMIASAPALSALDHPRYDVWVIRCTMS